MAAAATVAGSIWGASWCQSFQQMDDQMVNARVKMCQMTLAIGSLQLPRKLHDCPLQLKTTEKAIP